MATPLRDGDPGRIGPYRLEARLGGGGMGQVFLGRSPGGRAVAVKVIRPELAEDAGFRHRFAQEVAAAREVGGFYTAQVVGADTEAERPWLATAYIPGLALHQAVEEHGPLPAESVAGLGAGLAEGLAHAVAYRVVHEPPDLSGLPASLVEVVTACLAKDAHARPGVGEVIDRLALPQPAAVRWLPDDITSVISLHRTAVLGPEPPAPAPTSEPAAEPAASTDAVDEERLTESVGPVVGAIVIGAVLVVGFAVSRNLVGPTSPCEDALQAMGEFEEAHPRFFTDEAANNDPAAQSAADRLAQEIATAAEEEDNWNVSNALYEYASVVGNPANNATRNAHRAELTSACVDMGDMG
ncbi:protein kinase [Nocardiopsis sediminis]|uniref:Protein kinase n=1 Tax=Nocardiopsis sediminis TaxID=1778267 RepID=A0ABV8FV88_9ACTN